MDEFRQFGSIISVTTDAILARCLAARNHPEKIGSLGNRTTGIFLGVNGLQKLDL